jgi:hypothetical protein
LVFSLIILAVQSTAQDKVEREYKIQRAKVPQKAQDFIYETGILLPKTGVNWYREVSATGETVEAKFKQNNHRHSIEFSESGDLEDVEIEIPFAEVRRSIQASVEHALDSAFVKWKIKKIQRQWVGDPETMTKAIQTLSRSEGLEENYEIVIKGQSENTKSYFEALFNEEGELVRKSRIIQNSIDILIY